jgi:hypothetical protein
MVASLWIVRPVGAQVTDPPADAPFLAGPLTFAPMVQSNIGHDNNLFNRSEGDNPEGDFTATLSPMVDAWLQMARAKAGGRARVDFYYYKDFIDLRAVDWSSSGQLDVPLNRLTPFVGGAFAQTTNSQNLEIDAIARQRTGSLRLGSRIRVSERAALELKFDRSRLDYDQDALYDDVNLAEELDYVSKGGGLSFIYELTPLTTVGVEASIARDRFDVSTERDSDNASIIPYVQFQPFAVISGRASIGVQSRKQLSGTSPDFTGTVIYSDLTYTLLGQTAFTVSATRELQYSYIEGRTDYVESGLNLRVLHRLNDFWDVGGNIGRSRLSYRETITADDALISYPDELIFQSGMDVGYRFRRTRIGFRVDYSRRAEDSSQTFGNYRRTRAYTTVSYTF